MNEKSEHTDLFNRPIKVDDYIVYSAVDGRSATLRIGQVIALKTVKKTGWDGKDEIIAKVFCKSWNNFKGTSSWRAEKNGAEPSGRQKNVTLGFLTRVVVVDPSTVSEKVKTDLAGPICDYWGKPI